MPDKRIVAVAAVAAVTGAAVEVAMVAAAVATVKKSSIGGKQYLDYL